MVSMTRKAIVNHITKGNEAQNKKQGEHVVARCHGLPPQRPGKKKKSSARRDETRGSVKDTMEAQIPLNNKSAF